MLIGINNNKKYSIIIHYNLLRDFLQTMFYYGVPGVLEIFIGKVDT